MHNLKIMKPKAHKDKNINWFLSHQLLGFFTLFGLIIALWLFTRPTLPVSAGTEENQGPSFTSYLPVIARAGHAYYVSINGNDSNPGTLSKPLRTIGKAALIASAGDYIYIRNGVYNESVDFHNSGTSNAPITISAYRDEKPIIDGMFNSRWGSLVNILGDYITISGLEVRNSSGQCIHVYNSFDIIDNVYVHHCNATGIWVGAGHNSIVQNSRVWRTSLVNEYGKADGWATGISAARDGVSNVTIRNNVVWEIWGEGISSFEATHITIEGNIVHDSYSTNLYISDSTYVTCQRNFVYTDPTSYVFPYGSHIGIEMGDERYTPPSANNTVINNISYQNRVNFWWWQGTKGGGLVNSLIANNTFINSIGHSNVEIHQGDHLNSYFQNNIIQQNDSLPLILFGENPQLHFSHNLWSSRPPSAASSSDDIIGNPLFANIGDPFSPTWYKLTSTSPAIDQALPLQQVFVDYFGENRVAPPDIGATEFFFPIP